MAWLAFQPEEWTALMLSAEVAAWAVAVTLVPGVAVAWLLARKRFPGHALLDAVVHLPLVLPPVAVGYVLLVLLGRQGLVGGWLGVQVAFTPAAAVIASAVMGFPLLVRAARLGIEAVDPRLEAAASTLGAGRLRLAATVTLPMASPGVLTGMVLMFARSLGEFGATITIAGNIPGRTRTLPLAIYTYSQTPGGHPTAVRMVLLSVVLSFAALLGSELVARRVRRAVGTSLA